jgi:uncharacterized SAM-binding protein YcdF (DUF218 family)
MEVLLTKIATVLILPPGGNFLLAVIGVVLRRRAPLLATLALIVSVVTLYAFSLPRVGNALYASVETVPARAAGTAVADDVGAIVVLAGGRNANAPEYGGETVSAASLVRLRYAARLQRETGLPLLVSGGSVFEGETGSEAALMRAVLGEDLHVPVRWLEERSRNTAENARYSAELLRSENIDAIILVTHAAHMPRALEAFEKQGVRVHAAPTGRSWQPKRSAVLDWLPSSAALDASRAALHELVGRVWYWIRY